MVHSHTIGWQLIWCCKGGDDTVHEDQGPPFRLTDRSCMIQPPEIRHRVLHASDGIGVPAIHVTTIDHTIWLPNEPAVPVRRFQGQVFVHHRAEGAIWTKARPGFVARETGIAEATGGAAAVRVLRTDSDDARVTPEAGSHLVFVLAGALIPEADGGRDPIGPADAFVLPPGKGVRFSDVTPDTELLKVTSPAR